MIRYTLAILLVITCHIVLSPYTKVEESFTIQAVYDIKTYGVLDISRYDHIEFPGAVPRTFISPLVISLFTFMGSSLCDKIGIFTSCYFKGQIIARFVIGMFNAITLAMLAAAVDEVLLKKYQAYVKEVKNGNKAYEIVTKISCSKWYLFLITTQFHLMYYASRSLPNFAISLPLANLAFSYAIKERYDLAICMLSFGGSVFRLELGMISLGLSLIGYLYKEISFMNIVRYGAIGLFVGATISGVIDSYFWGRFVIPELDSFIFNIMLGQSSNWGVEPFYVYFTKYLPRLFVTPLIPFLAFSSIYEVPRSVQIILLTAIFHILVMSLLAHKEWRFIVYSLPVISLSASIKAAKIFRSSRFHAAIKASLLLMPILSLVITFIMTYISSMNYPGGEALAQFNTYILNNNIKNITVHLDVDTCMTGATLFGQLPRRHGIKYYKTETENIKTLWSLFDYIISASSDPPEFSTESNTSWELIGTTKSFKYVDFQFLRQFLSQQIQGYFPLLRDIYRQKSLKPIENVMNKLIINSDSIFTYKRIKD